MTRSTNIVIAIQKLPGGKRLFQEWHLKLAINKNKDDPREGWYVALRRKGEEVPSLDGVIPDGSDEDIARGVIDMVMEADKG